jgi:hypothetical protein
LFLNGTTSSIQLSGSSSFIQLAPFSGGGTVAVCADNTGTLKVTGCPGGGGGSAPFIDTTAILYNAAIPSKLLRFDLSGLTAATTRVLTPQDASYQLAGTNLANNYSVNQNYAAHLTFNAANTYDIGTTSNDARNVFGRIVSSEDVLIGDSTFHGYVTHWDLKAPGGTSLIFFDNAAATFMRMDSGSISGIRQFSIDAETIPRSDNTRDLGNGAARWRNFSAGGTATIGSLSSGGTAGVCATSAGLLTISGCPAAGGFSSGIWSAYTPTTTHLSGTTVEGAYNNYGKSVFFNMRVVGTSDGVIPTFGLPFTSSSFVTNQTFACIVDPGGGQNAAAPLNVGGTSSFQMRRYDNSAYTNGTTYTFVCNGVYESN